MKEEVRPSTVKEVWPRTMTEEVWPCTMEEVWPSTMKEVWPNTMIEEVWPSTLKKGRLAKHHERSLTKHHERRSLAKRHERRSLAKHCERSLAKHHERRSLANHNERRSLAKRRGKLVAGITQSVERPTEKPDAILTRVRVPGAARDFSHRVNVSYAVRTGLVCNRMHQHLRSR